MSEEPISEESEAAVGKAATGSGPLPRAPEVLVTERMIGRRIAPPDLADFQAFYADPQVVRALSAQAEPRTPEASARLFQGHLRHWEEHRFGTWIFRGSDGRFLGRGGLHVYDMPAGPEVELFYGVARDSWGQGLATEMARATIDVAFRDLGLPSLIAFTLPTNAASRRILEKCRFRPEGSHLEAGAEHLMFRLPGPAGALGPGS